MEVTLERKTKEDEEKVTRRKNPQSLARRTKDREALQPGMLKSQGTLPTELLLPLLSPWWDSHLSGIH